MSAAVLTDSTCDLTPDEQQRFGVFAIPLNVRFQGETFLDHHTISADQIFAGVNAGAALPRTTPPTLEQYRKVLEHLLNRHDHVLCVHLSSKLSETVLVARQAADLYPGRVTVVDSNQSSGALAMQAERASRLLKIGTPPATVAEVLNAVGNSATTRMGLDTLEYLKKNGRIGAATALLGGLLNMKPIVGLHEGKVIPVGRERGRQQAHDHMVRELTASLRKYARGAVRAVVFHSGDVEGASRLEETVRTEGAQLMTTSRLGSVLSSHGGPGVCGFSVEPVTVYSRFRAY